MALGINYDVSGEMRMISDYNSTLGSKITIVPDVNIITDCKKARVANRNLAINPTTIPTMASIPVKPISKISAGIALPV